MKEGCEPCPHDRVYTVQYQNIFEDINMCAHQFDGAIYKPVRESVQINKNKM